MSPMQTGKYSMDPQREGDRLGLYVMDEFCDNWLVHKNPYDYADQDFRAWWQQDLTAMVIGGSLDCN